MSKILEKDDHGFCPFCKKRGQKETLEEKKKHQFVNIECLHY